MPQPLNNRLAPILFGLICLLWGATWVPLKYDLRQIPPLLLAGTRFSTAGLLLLTGLAVRGALPRLARADLPRFLAVSALLMVGTYSLLFWGAQFVGSGLTAVLDLAFMPVALLLLGVAFGQDRLTPGRALGVGVGVSGLVVLFYPAIAGPAHGTTQFPVLGAAAIIGSAVIYALGSVLSRPLVRAYGPMPLSGATMLLGGLVLLAAALALEPGADIAAPLGWTRATWAGWVFLVLFGSIVAYTSYLELLRLWGAARAGAYAFISPIVAVALGMIAFHESVTARAAVGMLVMLAGAYLTLRPNAAGRRVDPITP